MFKVPFVSEDLSGCFFSGVLMRLEWRNGLLVLDFDRVRSRKRGFCVILLREMEKKDLCILFLRGMAKGYGYGRMDCLFCVRWVSLFLGFDGI